MNLHEYEVAHQAMNGADAIYRRAVRDFRDHRITDAQFLSAQKVFRAYEKEFDAAYEDFQKS